MQGVSLQRLAIVLVGDPLQGPRPPPVHRHRGKHHQECRQAGLNLHVTEEQAPHGLVDDPHASQQQQAGFDEGGKVLDFAVTILVVGIGGLVGNPHRKQRDDGGDQVESRVCGFRENSQAAGADSDHHLQRGDRRGRQHGVERHPALLAPHLAGAGLEVGRHHLPAFYACGAKHYWHASTACQPRKLVLA